MDEQNKTLRKESLTEFIEKNSKLISALAVFVTLSALVNKFPEEHGAKLLSFLLLTLAVLLFFEVFKNFREFEYYGKIYWFREVFVLAMLVFLYIWVRTYQPYLLSALILFLLCCVFLGTFVLLRFAVKKVVLRLPWIKNRKDQTKELVSLAGALALLLAGVLSIRLLR